VSCTGIIAPRCTGLPRGAVGPDYFPGVDPAIG